MVVEVWMVTQQGGVLPLTHDQGVRWIAFACETVILMAHGFALLHDGQVRIFGTHGVTSTLRNGDTLTLDLSGMDWNL